MSNASTESAQLSPEIQKQLSALNPQFSNASDELKQATKQVISTLIVENVTLKRENAQLKAEKSSKA